MSLSSVPPLGYKMIKAYTLVSEAFARHTEIEEIKARFMSYMKTMSAIRQVLDIKQHMHTGIMHVLFRDQEDYSDGDKLDSHTVTGATYTGMIGNSEISLVSDQRATDRNTGFVLADDFGKFHSITKKILATKGGHAELVGQMLHTVQTVVRTAMGQDAEESIHLAARVAKAFIDNWVKNHSGIECKVGSIIAGWHKDEATMYYVHYSQREGVAIRFERDPARPLTSGGLSGKVAERCLNNWESRSDNDCLINSLGAVAFASLLSPWTGGRIQAGRVPRNGNSIICTPIPVLQVVYHTYERLWCVLSIGFFMVAERVPFIPHTYEALERDMKNRLHFLQMHLISRGISRENGETSIFFLRFTDADTARVAFTDAQPIRIWGLGRLQFHESTRESIQYLYQLFPTTPQLP